MNRTPRLSGTEPKYISLKAASALNIFNRNDLVVRWVMAIIHSLVLYSYVPCGVEYRLVHLGLLRISLLDVDQDL